MTLPRARRDTVGKCLHYAYANLEMTRWAMNEGAKKYIRKHYRRRMWVYAAYRAGTRRPASLVRDDVEKLRRGDICAYCDTVGRTTSDHILPKSRGGPDTGDNIVRSCRSCNSRKGSKDLFECYATRGAEAFPPLFLVRTYLKLSIAWAGENSIMRTPLSEIELTSLPFRPDLIPGRFPLELQVEATSAVPRLSLERKGVV